MYFKECDDSAILQRKNKIEANTQRHITVHSGHHAAIAQEYRPFAAKTLLYLVDGLMRYIEQPPQVRFPVLIAE